MVLSLLYNSARISLYFDEASSVDRLEFAIVAREACNWAAMEIHALLRRFRHQYGLRPSPLIMVYALAQAIRATRAFDSNEGTKSLVESMSGVADTWALANKVMHRPGEVSKSSEQAE